MKRYKATNNKIRICFFAPFVYPLFKGLNERHGGAEVQVYLITTELAKKEKFSVSLLVWDYGQPSVEIIKNVRLIKLTYNYPISDQGGRRFFNRFLRRFFAIWIIATQKCDFFIPTMCSEYSGYIALIRKIFINSKVIYRTASDFDCEYKNILGKLGAFLFYFTVKYADVIVSQTEFQKILWKNKYARDSIIINSGIKIVPQKRVSDKDIVLWVGRAASCKQPELFVELARKMPEEKFCMIIIGDEKIAKDIEMCSIGVKNLDIKNKYIMYNKIQNYFNRAKCLVNTSTVEGFPNVFLQACLGKTPILSFNINPDGFITKNDIGFVCNGNIDDAVQYLKYLDDNSIKRQGKNGLRYIKENHDLAKVALQYEAIMSPSELR